MPKNQKLIIHVVQHLKPGGLEKLVIDMVNFSSNKHMIISLEGNKPEALQHWSKLNEIKDNIYFFDKKPSVQASLIMKLYNFFKSVKPDVVHSHHIGPLFYAGMAVKAAGVQHLIHTEHDVWHLQNTKRRILQHAVLKSVKPYLVADAKKIGNELKAYFPKQNITTILNGIDTKRFIPNDKTKQRALLGLPQSILLIGTAGRLEQVKGHDKLICALALLPENVHLAIAGTGSLLNALKKQSQKLNLDHRVHFVGYIEKIEHFYQAIDVFCLPSNNEGYPLSALEAQSCNVPTAVTHVGSAHETLCPQSGKLLKPKNIAYMASTLFEMLVNSERNQPKPRQFVCETGDIRQTVFAYEKLIDENRG